MDPTRSGAVGPRAPYAASLFYPLPHYLAHLLAGGPRVAGMQGSLGTVPCKIADTGVNRPVGWRRGQRVYLDGMWAFLGSSPQVADTLIFSVVLGVEESKG